MPPPAGQEIGEDSHGAAILRLSVLVGTSRGAGRLFNQQVHFRRDFCPFPAVDKRCFTISSGLIRDCLDSAESRAKSRRRISFSNRHAIATFTDFVSGFAIARRRFVCGSANRINSTSCSWVRTGRGISPVRKL